MMGIQSIKESVRTISNMELHPDYVLLSVNPKIYPLDIVYSASYAFLDRAYLFINGDPEKEILVELRSKTAGDLEELGREFNNELLNYAVYKLQSDKNQDIRQMIVAKAVQMNNPECSEDDYLDDPLGIAKPWEETHKNE
jgi:His-Xaa-Ser system protein HxsD